MKLFKVALEAFIKYFENGLHDFQVTLVEYCGLCRMKLPDFQVLLPKALVSLSFK
jgi:hypothetical protein